MDNEINVLHALHGSLYERAHDKGAISRFLPDTSTNAWGSILYLYECINSRRCKITFLCNTLWVGQKERGRLQLNIASLSIHGSVTVSRQEPLDTDNDCAVCNDNPAETTSDPAQFRLQFYSEI